jgi:hypothetical protein
VCVSRKTLAEGRTGGGWQVHTHTHTHTGRNTHTHSHSLVQACEGLPQMRIHHNDKFISKSVDFCAAVAKLGGRGVACTHTKAETRTHTHTVLPKLAQNIRKCASMETTSLLAKAQFVLQQSRLLRQKLRDCLINLAFGWMHICGGAAQAWAGLCGCVCACLCLCVCACAPSPHNACRGARFASISRASIKSCRITPS